MSVTQKTLLAADLREAAQAATGSLLLAPGHHTLGISSGTRASGSAVPAPLQSHAITVTDSEGQHAAAAQSVDMQSAANSGAAEETTAVNVAESPAPKADSATHARSGSAQSAGEHAPAAADPAAAGATAEAAGALNSHTALPNATVLPPAAEAAPAVLLQRTSVIPGHLAAVPLIVSLYGQEHAESGAGEEEVYGVRPDSDPHYCDMVRREYGGAVPTLKAMLEAIICSDCIETPELGRLCLCASRQWVGNMTLP